MSNDFDWLVKCWQAHLACPLDLYIKPTVDSVCWQLTAYTHWICMPHSLLYVTQHGQVSTIHTECSNTARLLLQLQPQAQLARQVTVPTAAQASRGTHLPLVNNVGIHSRRLRVCFIVWGHHYLDEGSRGRHVGYPPNLPTLFFAGAAVLNKTSLNP